MEFLEIHMRVVQMSLITHGFQLENPQLFEDVKWKDVRMVIFNRRLACIEKICQDKSLMAANEIGGQVAGLLR